MIKKNLKIIIISLIIILIVGIIGLLYYSNNKKDNNKETNNTTSTKVYGAYKDKDELVDVLAKSFTSYNTCDTGIKLNIKDKVYYNDLNETNINHIIFNYLNIYEHDELTITLNANGKHVIIPKNKWEDAIKKLFGKKVLNNYTFKDEITIRDGKFKLINNNYEGDIPINMCFGTYPSFRSYYTELVNNSFNVEYMLYYLENKPIVKENRNVEIQKNVYVNKDDTTMLCTEDEIHNYIDRFIKYRFVFVKEDDYFIFDHIELVK